MSNQVWVGITGAAGGLGREFCREYASKGFKILAIDKSQKGLQELSNSLPDNIITLPLDVTQKAAIFETLTKISLEMGPPAVWINNAGIAHLEFFHAQSLENFEKVMNVNFLAAIYATHFWLPSMMEKNSGMIINIASMAGRIAAPTMSSYNASKAALIATSECLQRELEVEKSKVRVVVVNPGFVKTDIVRLGQKDGIPENMQFMLTQPQDCVKEIIKKVERGEDVIVPTMSGKMMHYMERLSPGLTSYLSVKFGESKK